MPKVLLALLKKIPENQVFYTHISLHFLKVIYVAQVISLLRNFIQLSLNSGSVQLQSLLTACRRFAMVRISDNGPGWK